MATLAPPSISSVLASSSYRAPSAPAPSYSAPSWSSSGWGGSSSAAVWSIAYYTNQWMTLAQAQKARQDATSWIVNPTTLNNPNSSLAEWSAAWYQSRWFDSNSAKNLAKDYAIKMWNTYEVFNDASTGWTYLAKAPNWTPIASTITGRAWPVSTPTTYKAPDIQKIQVGKLVSNFKTGFSSSGWDRANYRNSINYDSLSKKEKVVADRLFDAEKKKKDEEDNIIPTKIVTVVRSVPNTNGTVTNYLSDGTTSIVRETPTGRTTATWVPIISAVEVWDRTGLKTVTPSTPADSVAGIRTATPSMSIADARAESLRRRSAGFVPANAVVDTNPDTQYITETEDVIDNIKTQADTDRAEQVAAMENNRAIAQTYNDSLIADNQNALSTFEGEQDKLLKGYESNRLNQVQWDLRRILLERGVDVSKVTPEQLIALSGTVWVNAFKDVSSAKERATASIETARQNALAKVSQLKSNNVLNQTQYNTAIADINSKTESQKNNLDLKLAELKFGVLTNAAATAKTDAQAVAQNVLATAQALGVTGTQMGLVQSFIKNAKSTPEAISRLLAELQNPNSPLYTTLKSNENATSKAAQFNAALKQYEAETDRLKAQASVTSANRPRSSGSATVVYGNPTVNQQ